MKYYALGLLLLVSATAVLGAHVIPTPEFVNIYWDSNWDTDNPSMPKVSLDSFTAAMVASTYFAGLQEYGVTSSSFGGGFLPAPDCGQRSPNRPGFWGDPFASTIMSFLGCEIDHGLPKGPSVIYNIILPAYALESDFAGTRTFCQGSNPTAWHFHGIFDQNVPPLPLNLTEPALQQWALAFAAAEKRNFDDPVFTITMTNPACGLYTNNLLHEMTEAATNPFPSVHTVLWGSSDEIADVCEKQMTSNSFATPGSLGTAVLAGGNGTAPPFTANISVPSYRSDLKRECIAGFSDQTVPTGLAITVNGGQGGTASMTVNGSGFGTLPLVFPTGSEVTLPYIAIQDVTQGWQAGNALNGDGRNGFTVGISNWSPNSLTINGIGNPGTSFTMRSSDQLSMWVCEPASGQCGGASGSQISMPPGPYLPNLSLALVLVDVQHLAPYVTFTVDGNPSGALFGNGNTSPWITLGIGSHQIVAAVPGLHSAEYEIRYSQDCDASGKITLGDGDNRTCAIVVTTVAAQDSSGCGIGETCCEPSATGCKKCTKLPRCP